MHPGAFLLRVPLPDVLVWYPLLLGADILKVLVRRRPLVAARARWPRSGGSRGSWASGGRSRGTTSRNG